MGRDVNGVPAIWAIHPEVTACVVFSRAVGFADDGSSVARPGIGRPKPLHGVGGKRRVDLHGSEGRGKLVTFACKAG